MNDYDLLKEENERLAIQNMEHLNTIKGLLEANAKLTETINNLLSEAEDKVRLD